MGYNVRIKIRNIGVLKQAEFDLGDLTIICGKNNTGKTYATYALYGFLSYWQEVFEINVSEDKMRQLLNDGAIELDLQDYIKNANKILHECCEEFTEQLPTVFASSQKYFSKSEFVVTIDNIGDIRLNREYGMTMGAPKTRIFSISKTPEDTTISVSLLVEKEKIKIPKSIISKIIGDSIKEIVFGHFFPNTFIASSERTGVAIFRKELNLARNRLFDQISTKEKDINPFELITRLYSDYPLPVKKNVEFTRRLEEFAKYDSFIAKKDPSLLASFANIIGGEYIVSRNDELYYTPKGHRIRLSMDESSSAVRSLLDIGFYLRHVAKEGDLLMVDEPELNLHPENQRLVARLFARLVNIGINVFITTHSDYIVKEFSTLIMLNQDKPYLKKIAEEEGYSKEELLSAKRVKVYIAETGLLQIEGARRRSRGLTLNRADVDPELGIEARSFDATIDNMNRIQESILFGGEDD